MDTQLVPGCRIARRDAKILAELRRLGLPGNDESCEPRFLKLGNEHGEYYRIIRCNDDEELTIVKAAIARAGFYQPVDKLIEPRSRGLGWVETIRNWIHRL